MDAPAQNVLPRGDKAFNMAAYLWSLREKQVNGRDMKDMLGPNSPEYNFYVQKAAQNELNGQDGGFLAPEEWTTDFHDVIRDNSTFRSLPVQRFTTTARLQHVAVAMSDWTFGYGLDNSAAASADRKFAQRNANMRKATGLATISNELLRDASDMANQFLRQSAGEAVAFEQDKQCLWGNGQAGAPLGLLNMTNVGTTDIAGASPTMAQIETMVFNAKTLNQSANVPTGSVTDVAVVANPQIELTIRKIASAGSLPILFGLGTDPIQQMLGVKWILTGAVPITFTNKTTSTGGSQTQIFAGDWRRLRIVQRFDIAFEISPEATGSGTTGYQSDQSLIRVVMRYDVMATHPEAFNVITSAIQ